MRKAPSHYLFAKNPASMVSPAVDFLMVGGLTLILFPVALLPMWNSPLGDQAAIIAFCMNFVLSFPHFAHGYQLLYKGYVRKISDAGSPLSARLRYIVSGIVAPLAMMAFLVYGALQPTNHLIGAGANAMFFFIGWHYVKQGYGILMTLSAKKKVYYAELDKKLFLINAYIVWIVAWIHFNAVVDPAVFQKIPYHPLPVTAHQDLMVKSAFVVWTLFMIAFFIKRSDRYPAVSFNGLVGYISALYPWLLFMLISPLMVLFVPALHSLQYLLFVWKLEYTRTRTRLKEPAAARHSVLRHMLPFLIFGFGAGALCLFFIPWQLDTHIAYKPDIFGSRLFTFCFLIFFNTHHYFIDFAIWRRDNPEMKYLFQ